MGAFSNRAAALVAVSLAIALVPGTATAGWSSPVRVSARPLTDPAIAVDAADHRHVIARGEDGLWYVTDRSGPWTERRLTRDGPGVGSERVRAHDPDVAVDPEDGSVVVAWVLSRPAGTGGCSGDVRYRTHREGRWTTVKAIPTHGCAGPIDIEARGGRITLAAQLSGIEYRQIELVAGRPGSWSSTLLGEELDGPDPSRWPFARQPSLELDAAGRSSLAYEKGAYLEDGSTWTTVRWAHREAGTPGLTSERVRRYAGEVVALELIDLVLDSAGRPRIAWVDMGGTVVAVHGSAGWTFDRATDFYPVARDLAIGVDGAGRTVLAVANGVDGLRTLVRRASGWAGSIRDAAFVATVGGLARGSDGDLHLVWQRGRWHGSPHVWVSRLS